jgi:hypothetical protein
MGDSAEQSPVIDAEAGYHLGIVRMVLAVVAVLGCDIPSFASGRSGMPMPGCKITVPLGVTKLDER